MTRLDRSALALAVSLSALAGYVDALGFLKLGGYFVSFMSGNSTQAGVDLIKGGPLLPFLLILGFVAGVIGGSMLGPAAGKNRRPALLGVVALLLLAAAGFHLAGWDAAVLAAMVLAMGAENTIFEENGDVRFGVTYVTGSLVKMGQHIASALRGGRRGDWVPFFLLWAGLVAGAIAGGASYLRWGLGSLWIAGSAALVLTGFAATSTRSDR
jgi:uncharacterized membrane protein YoaK (UPF0700 family)